MAPALVIDAKHSVLDVSAVVREAPVGGPISMRLQRDGVSYCTLTILAGEFSSSEAISGFGMAPLEIGSQLTLDITAVPGAPGTLPGRDLTVTVRL